MLLSKVMSLRSVQGNVVAITEAWQILTDTCYMEDYELFHHLCNNGSGEDIRQFFHKELHPSPSVLKF